MHSETGSKRIEFKREYVIRLWVYAILKNFSPIRFKWNEAATFFNKN